MLSNLRIAALALLGGGLLAGQAVAQPTGKELFEMNCSACHQVTGMGVPGAFPALAGNAFVQGPATPVATTVLNGRGGMPSFRDDLSRAQIATILTYVRSAWGNKAPPIDEATVTAAPGGVTGPVEPPSPLGFH